MFQFLCGVVVIATIGAILYNYGDRIRAIFEDIIKK
jgi:hypothetical protein